MKVKASIVVYPYLQPNGSINVSPFHSDDMEYWGICLVGQFEGITTEFEVEVEMPENPTKAIIDAFEKEITKVRADAQVAIERIEEQKQKFLALESS